MARLSRTSSLPLIALACSASALVALNFGVASGDEPETIASEPSGISELQCHEDEQLAVVFLNVIDPTDETDPSASIDEANEPGPPPSIDEAIEEVADGPVIPGDAADLTSEVVEEALGHRKVSMSDDEGETAIVTLTGSPAEGWIPERIEVCQP